ncbi:hypothetical protein [Rhizobium sp. ZW T2_16]
MDEDALKLQVRLVGRDSAVDMTLLRVISSSQRVWSPAFRSLDLLGNMA